MNTLPLLLLLLLPAPEVITVDGTVLDGITYTSQLSIKAHNVTVRNCEILMPPDETQGWYGISNVYNDASGMPRSTNLLIENCVVRGGTTGIYVQYATVLFNDVQEVGKDAMKVSTKGNCRVIGNHVARLGLTPGSHADGIQLVGGSNVVIAYNHFDIPISHNGNADISRIFIYGNLFDGGNFSVFLTHKTGSPHVAPTLCRMNNNTFTHDYRYGPFSWDYDPLIQVNGNLWDDGTFMDINTWDDWPSQ